MSKNFAPSFTSLILFRAVICSLDPGRGQETGKRSGARVSIALRFGSPRSAPTATMMQRKSLLNPYATPYVPLSKIVPGVCSERENGATLDDSENNETIEKYADCQLPDSVFVDYDIQGLEKLQVSDESSSKIGEPWNSDVTFQDVIPRSEKQNAVDDPDLILEFLSSLFPNISIESLAEVFNANHGDLNQTIYVLEQLEYGGYELENFAESSETTNSLDDPPEKASASGTISSV